MSIFPRPDRKKVVFARFPQKKEEKARKEGPFSLYPSLSLPGTRPKALATNRLKLLNEGSTGASTVNRRTLFRSRAQAG